MTQSLDMRGTDSNPKTMVEELQLKTLSLAVTKSQSQSVTQMKGTLFCQTFCRTKAFGLYSFLFLDFCHPCTKDHVIWIFIRPPKYHTWAIIFVGFAFFFVDYFGTHLEILHMANLH